MSDTAIAAWMQTVMLPVGAEDDAGEVVAALTVRMLTGNEEALLLEPRLRQNGGKLVTALLASCTRTADGGGRVSPETVRRLPSADRNYLLLAVRRLTFGDELEARYQCPRCSEPILVVEDLGDVPVRTLADGALDEIPVELRDGYRDAAGDIHRDLLFRLPTGADEEAAASRREANPVRQRDALLARCLLRVGELEPRRIEAFGARILADLSMFDRRAVQQALDASAPGPDLVRTITCERCCDQFRTMLDMSRFFLQS